MKHWNKIKHGSAPSAFPNTWLSKLCKWSPSLAVTPCLTLIDAWFESHAGCDRPWAYPCPQKTKRSCAHLNLTIAIATWVRNNCPSKTYEYQSVHSWEDCTPPSGNNSPMFVLGPWPCWQAEHAKGISSDCVVKSLWRTIRLVNAWKLVVGIVISAVRNTLKKHPHKWRPVGDRRDLGVCLFYQKNLTSSWLVVETKFAACLRPWCRAFYPTPVTLTSCQSWTNGKSCSEYFHSQLFDGGDSLDAKLSMDDPKQSEILLNDGAASALALFMDTSQN